jgi:hypothetical protein
MKKILLLSFITYLALTSCKKNESNPTNGTVNGTITNIQEGTALANANIEFFNSVDNSPTAYATTSGSDGKYSISLPAGTYLMKISNQGYNSIPPEGISAVPVVVTAGQTIPASYQMVASSITNAGYVSGKVVVGTTPKQGVLVIVSGNAGTYSGTSGTNGIFTIYNVPAGSYTLKGYIASFNSNPANVTITQNAKTTASDLILTSGATGTVSGSVTFLATTNIEVDVSLVIPGTNSTIPGLTVMTSSGNYTLTNVPNGTFIARASWANDNKVVDPDWIIKSGEPIVIVNSNNVSLNFSLTGSVLLISPSNALTTTVPVEVTTASPVFSWTAYASTDNYVLEVIDMNGTTVWGGISGTPLTRKVIIAKTQTSATYNFDATGQALQNGKTYRWRVYASKNDSGQALGWKLISASEEQMGLFKIKI